MSVRLLAAVRINISLVHGRARSTRGPRRSGPAAVGDHQSRDQRHRSDAISHKSAARTYHPNAPGRGTPGYGDAEGLRYRNLRR